MVGKKRKTTSPGCYDAALVELRSRADDDGSTRIVLTAGMKITRSYDLEGQGYVGRRLVGEFVLDGDGGPTDGVGRERLVEWASWIKKHGWICLKA